MTAYNHVLLVHSSWCSVVKDVQVNLLIRNDKWDMGVTTDGVLPPHSLFEFSVLCTFADWLSIHSVDFYLNPFSMCILLLILGPGMCCKCAHDERAKVSWSWGNIMFQKVEQCFAAVSMKIDLFQYYILGEILFNRILQKRIRGRMVNVGSDI